MPTILDDLKLQLGAFAAILRPQINTADRTILMPLDKSGTLMLVEDLASPVAIGGTTPNTIAATTITTSSASAFDQVILTRSNNPSYGLSINNQSLAIKELVTNKLIAGYKLDGNGLPLLILGVDAGAGVLAKGTIRSASVSVFNAVNLPGSNLAIASGAGVGTGTLPDITFDTPDLAASGTTGQTTTTKMLLKGRGALLIGTTTDNGTDKLQVAGSGLFTGALKTSNASAAVSTTSGAFQVVGGAGIGGDTWLGGLVNGAIKFLKSAVTGVNAVLQAEDNVAANINLVLQPKGTGAIVAGLPPDGAATGGNARGLNAIDLQTARLSNTKVASGSNSAISGGNNNAASGNYSAISGGNGNTASGSNCVVAGGVSNIAVGNTATIAGGNGNTASGNYSAIAGGLNALSDKYGQFAQGTAQFAGQGDAQTSVLVARASTTTATPTDLFLDGTTQRIVLGANNSSWTYLLTLNAHSITDRTKQAAFFRRGKIYKLLTAASTAILIGEIADNIVGALPWTVAISADTTNGALKITVTGDATNTIQWVARIELTETFG
jgi:hypothetical protein